MSLPTGELALGTELFISHLNQLIESDREISEFHEAFEAYCKNRYSLGNYATNQRVGGANDLGIDFYSQRDSVFVVGQSKIPERDWLEANPGQVKLFGPSVLSDPIDALRYLLGESKLNPNDRVRQLYAEVQTVRNKENFRLTFFLVVYGRLNPRARDQFESLKGEFPDKRVSIILQEIDDLVDEFLVGSNHPSGEIRIDLRLSDEKNRFLRAHDYCYFLANAADLFNAFKNFGWRLFDLNLRYEIANSAVNGDIVDSLKFHKTRRNFHHYNNGLVVMCENYTFLDKDTKIRLTGAQIVNGLQTVKSIYNAVSTGVVKLEDLERDCVVQVKAINTSDADFVSKVVRSTNNQNPMHPRNLKSNDRQQRILRKSFALLQPRWFFQVKEGEWRSLAQEGTRFFEQVVGFSRAEFRPDPKKQAARVIDNQTAAKAWLAFAGFSDQAGDRVTHFFGDDDVYSLAFSKSPDSDYWTKFAAALDWSTGRKEALQTVQADPRQYLLAYFLLEFGSNFIPSPARYREQGLNEGVKDGKIKKASGSFVTPQKEQDAYLAENRTYQTWRLMANMKELLVEVAAQILCRKYGAMSSEVAGALMQSFEAKDFFLTGDTRDTALAASSAKDLPTQLVYSRLFRFLHHASQQFWEEKKTILLSTSRLRTLLLKREVAADFKSVVWELNGRVGLDKPWKPEGITFLDSLPKLAKAKGA